jgi:hypothetical protein
MTRLQELEALVKELEEIEKTTLPIPEDEFSRRCYKICQQMKVSNVEIYKILKEEIKKEQLKNG